MHRVCLIPCSLFTIRHTLLLRVDLRAHQFPRSVQHHVVVLVSRRMSSYLWSLREDLPQHRFRFPPPHFGPIGLDQEGTGDSTRQSTEAWPGSRSLQDRIGNSPLHRSVPNLSRRGLRLQFLVRLSADRDWYRVLLGCGWDDGSQAAVTTRNQQPE